MDEHIPSLYKEYGKYVNSSRAFPLDIDGLKPVERKILLSAYLIARDKFVKSVKVDGICLGNFHPHSSAYGTIVQLVHQGFLEGQGNFGVNVGIEDVGAAAARYTEVKLSKYIKDMAFKYLDFVLWEINELQEKEPIHLPTMFPLCLLGNNYIQGIGFGYRTIIPCYTLEDLTKRLMFLLGKIKKEPIIKPISDCKIISKDSDLKKLLTTGKANIEFKGIMKVDNIHSRVIIKSWPGIKKFESILKKITKELENQDVGFTDLSTTETNIVIEVIKQRNKADILNRVVKKLEEALTGSISFDIIVTDRMRNIRTISVDELLLNTYKMFKNVNEIRLNHEINILNKHIDENILIEKIKPLLINYLKTNYKDPSEIIEKISKNLKIEKDIINSLFNKHKINKLLSVKLDNQKLKDKINEFKNNLKNIDEYVNLQYQN